MRFTWYGHAAFLIETQGLRIIFDPYRSPESGGYLPIDEPADLVIVSHDDQIYHSYSGQIPPPFQLVGGRWRYRPAARSSRASASRPCTPSRRRSGGRNRKSRSPTFVPRTCMWSTWATSGTL